MSPLRYRCATGPWRFILLSIFVITAPLEKPARIALATRHRFSRLHLARSCSLGLPYRSARARYLPLRKCLMVHIFFGRVPQARGVYILLSISVADTSHAI